MAEETVAVNATNSTLQVANSTAEQIHSSFQALLQNSGLPWMANLVQYPFVFFIVSVVIGLILSYGLAYLSRTVIKAFTRRTETDIDDQLLERLTHPAALFLFVLSLNIALVPLSLNSTFALVANKLLLSLNILLVAVMVNRSLAIILRHYGARVAAKTDSSIDDQVLPLLNKIIAVIIYIIAFLVILAVFGVEIAPLLAGAGIAGIALAFAMQESLKNIFGGISLAFDGAFGIGDRIKLSDGTIGTVQDISLRATKIRTFDGDLLIVPNGKIANENFQTYAQPTQETRVVINFGVAYGTDVEKVKKVVLEAIKGIEYQFERPKDDILNRVQFVEMAAYSLNFRATFWVTDYRHSWDAKLTATDRIHTALNKAKIEIPFPVQTLYLREEGKKH